MERKNKITVLLSIMALLLHVVLNIRMQNGYLLRMQGWVNVSIVTILFWVFWIVLSYAILRMDVGFIKFGGAIALFTGVLALVYIALWNTTDYELLSNGEHELLVRFEDGPNERRIYLYKKDGLLFSKYYTDTWIAAHFSVTYDIIGDDFVVYRCATASCTTEEIPIE